MTHVWEFLYGMHLLEFMQDNFSKLLCITLVYRKSATVTEISKFTNWNVLVSSGRTITSRRVKTKNGYSRCSAAEGVPRVSGQLRVDSNLQLRCILCDKQRNAKAGTNAEGSGEWSSISPETYLRLSAPGDNDQSPTLPGPWNVMKKRFY